MSIIVAGIGTEVGKTIISAILCEALKADYWKPIQAGDLSHSDSDKVASLVSNSDFVCHKEAYRLSTPMSPHASAKRDGVKISRAAFTPPVTKNPHLVVEMAGGIMVPLSDEILICDLISDLALPVMLVANYYLGSINHTLLSIELLKQRQCSILGLIFNGETQVESRDIILKMSNLPLIAEIPHTQTLDKTFIKTHAEKIQYHTRLARL